MPQTHTDGPRQPISRRNTFAIIHTWPDLKNAEYEVLQRVLLAAARIGKSVVVIDSYGRVIWSSPHVNAMAGQQLDPAIVGFTLSLHFKSPRVVDTHSFYALWQPTQFYFDHEYQRSIEGFSSHSDMLSCGSSEADAHAINVMEGLGRPPQLPLPKLYHCPPEPFAEPAIRADARLFYVGINWERIGRPKGRFHDTLVQLDKAELTRIYGPERILGAAPWEGFATYEGELPFDGRSVQRAINRAGICLALSSAQHKASGVMSNRLFEGLAGGAAVIATPHPLIDRMFADVVYQVDDSRGDAVLSQQIVEAMKTIRSDPDEATRRTLRGQAILREHCLPENSIAAMFAELDRRTAHFETTALCEVGATVIVRFSHGTKAELLAQIGDLRAQKRARLDVHILCDPSVGLIADELDSESGDAVASIHLHHLAFDPAPFEFDGPLRDPARTGSVILSILEGIETELFCFLVPGERLFSDHLASLGRALRDLPGALVACSGSIIETADPTGAGSIRSFDSLRFTDHRSVFLVDGPREAGRFVYSARLIDAGLGSLFALLDGEEHRYFRVSAATAGPLAQSGYATYVRAGYDGPTADGGESAARQRQFIRDRLALDPAWTRAAGAFATAGSPPVLLHTYAPGSPVRWNDERPPNAVRQLIIPERSYEVRAGGEGLEFLVAGFSHPEAEHVWLAAERAVIEFALPHGADEGDEDYELILTVAGRHSQETGRTQHCTASINEVVVGYFIVPEAVVDLRIAIPRGLRSSKGLYRVQLAPDHREPVRDRDGAVIDERQLSIMLKGIRVAAHVPQQPPTLISGRRYDCGEGGRGLPMLVKGFYAAEHRFSWMAGNRSIIRFSLRRPMRKPRFFLTVADPHPYRSNAAGFEVYVNGHLALVERLGPSVSEFRFDIDPALIERQLTELELRVDNAGPLLDQQGSIVDGRRLGAALYALRVVDRGLSWRRRMKSKGAAVLRKMVKL